MSRFSLFPVFLGVLVLLLLLAQGQPAFAVTLTVTRTDDPTPDGCANNGCSLREAINAANATPGSTITLPNNVPDGHFILTIRGDSEDLNATGDLDITANLTITGAGANTTIIDATGLGDRVFHVVAGTVTISGVTIQHGSVGTQSGIVGGGIYTQGTLNLLRSAVNANAASRGGGILASGALTLTESTVSGNTATDDAGLYLVAATITNSTISGNTTGGATGSSAIYNLGTLTLTSSTIAGNMGGVSALYEQAPINMKNTIVANNVPLDCIGDIASAGHNLIGNTSGCSGFIASDLQNTPARLDGLALNPPGTTRTHALCPTDSGGPTSVLCSFVLVSPAIDAGDNARCPATDQRGVPRPQPPGGACDIGAYELQTPTCDLKITKTASPNPVQSGQPVTITLSVENVGIGMCQGVTTVTDNLPIGLQVASVAQGGSLWNCSVTGANPPATVTCTWDASIQAVPPGPLPAITITATVTARQGSSQNCGAVTNTNDTNTANNESCVIIQVTGVCDLAITKAISPSTLVVGQTATITITVTNVGTGSCAPLNHVQDDLPAALTLISPPASSTDWLCGGNINIPSAVFCNSGSPFTSAGPLPPLYMATFAFPVKAVGSPGNYTNCATAAMIVNGVGVPDSNPNNDSSCAPFTILQPPPTATSSTGEYCISGNSTGVGWDWKVDYSLLSGGMNTFMGTVAPGAVLSPFQASEIATAWSLNINVSGNSGLSASHVASSNCFRVLLDTTLTGAISPFAYFVYVRTSGGAWCLITNNPSGCSFNPTVTYVAPVGGAVALSVTEGGSPFPSLPLAAGAAAALAVLAVGGLYARRRWLR